MTTVAGLRVPVVSEAFVWQRAQALVTRGGARVEILRAVPEWSGEPSHEFAGVRVHVCQGVSQLAILDAYERLPDGDSIVVLTDRTEQDLGDCVLVRAHGRTIEAVDVWSSVPELFGASISDRGLRAVGSWVPGALLDYLPPGGWPPPASEVVTAGHALTCLLARVLGLPLPTDLDEVALVQALDDRTVRAAWQSTDSALRAQLTGWARDGIGPVAGLALAAASAGSLSVVAVGLALDVLWPGDSRHGLPLNAAQIAARARIEPRLGGQPIAERDARELAAVASAVAVRMDANRDVELEGVIAQAEALLADVGWAAGAASSTVLRAGLVDRVRQLAAAIIATLAEDAPSAAVVEGALVEVHDHRLSRPDDVEIAAARMAVRLVRWWCTPAQPLAPALGAAILEQVADGGWVDRALAAVWTGSADPVVAAAYGELAARVQQRRRARDENAAQLLAEATEADIEPTGVVPIEDLRARVIAPLATAAPVLLVVIDGMSVAVASELAEAATALGWTELLPPGSGGVRTGALAVLPTETTYSRTSLFAGELLGGQAATENSRYSAALRSRVFHKDDLRSEGGALLPASLLEALGSERERAVAVVLNTVDDALSKADPGGTRWTEDTVQHLRALLNAAAMHGRTVILTSDHGHVIERGSEARSVVGADARWRPVESGPVNDGEVLVRGRRVLSPGGAAVLAWRDDLRYGTKQAGYHGGASLAELAIPVIVLARGAEGAIAGWEPGPPQAPMWWNDAVVTRPAPRPGGRRDRRTGKATVERVAPACTVAPTPVEVAFGQGLLGFNVAPVEPVVPRGPFGVVEALLASPGYEEQRARAGRRALPPPLFAAVLTALVERGGRAHRDTVAAAGGVAAAAFDGTLAALKRLLNVEGYAVVSLDADAVTVVLDVPLLREQFGLM